MIKTLDGSSHFRWGVGQLQVSAFPLLNCLRIHLNSTLPVYGESISFLFAPSAAAICPCRHCTLGICQGRTEPNPKPLA